MDRKQNLNRILHSPTYRKAFEDVDFLKRDELRPVRLQLELLKPEMIMNEQRIRSTIVVFGSARILCQAEAERCLAEAEAHYRKNPDDVRLKQAWIRARRDLEHARYYEQAREFGRIVSTSCQIDGECDFVIITGGGPGIMEAANRGAYEIGAKSIGLNITLAHEQTPNPFITPELCFQFRYFALRKMHFLLRARALVVFPGGFGTLDELFETLTLIQTQKMPKIPVLLFGREYWEKLINFQFLAEQGMITEEDLQIFEFVESANEAWERITHFYADKEEWTAVVEK